VGAGARSAHPDKGVDLGSPTRPPSAATLPLRGRDSAPLAADRARALELTPVSRETAERLDRFVEILLEWQQRTNLISASTVAHLWTRHIADSLQLVSLAPKARSWVDVGSGAGFPGLIIACALAGTRAAVHLVESNGKKAAFLRAAQRLTDAPAVVHQERMEDFVRHIPGPVDVVCARAVLPLKSLLRLCYPLLGKTAAVGLFPKGQNAQLELEEAAKIWSMHATLVPSRTDPASRIVVVREVSPQGRIYNYNS
jgi:16S rRNA (guanine527-N7)-methyltransferase